MKIITLLLIPFVLFSFHHHRPIGSDVKTQVIPGRLECELYDTGGEGIAYHDTDSINNGSGKLNPANGTYLNEFRKDEGVDISYTKPNAVDENPFNKVNPKMGKLYVGWTVPGEWINYSVNVKKSGSYELDLLYTANGNAVIGIDVDGQSILPKIDLISTHDEKDTIAWRQWHHWNKMNSLATMRLAMGKHRLTVRIVENGNVNLDYIDFKKQ